MSHTFSPTPTFSSDDDDSQFDVYFYGAGGAFVGLVGLTAAYMFCYAKSMEQQVFVSETDF